MASYQETKNEQLSTPPILWHQDNHFVFFKVDIQKVKDEVINITENNFLFKTSQYFIDFELSYEINPDESSFSVTEKFVKVSLAKKESFIKWTSLTKNKALYKNNIKIDWNSWYDSDAEEDEDLPKSRNDFSNVDFASMMQQMQGMGGGGMDSMVQQMQGLSEEELAQFQNSVDCDNDECEGCDTCDLGENQEDYSDMPELIADDEDDSENISE